MIWPTEPSGLHRNSPRVEVVCGFYNFHDVLNTSVISVVFYSESEKSDKFCSEALISA